MSDIVLASFKVGFLAVLWLFVLVVANVVRTDLAGRTVVATDEPGLLPHPGPSQRPSRRGRTKKPRVLAITSGTQAGQRLLLVERFRIGRTADCELKLDDDYVSTAHAELQHTAMGEWILTDLGSTNGTFVNGERVSSPTPVTTADTFRIGRTQMKLET